MVLYVGMFVAGANKVKGAMIRCLSWHLLNMAWLKVRQGHFETAIVILHNVLSLKTASGVLKHYIKYLHDSKLCTVMHLFKVSYYLDRLNRPFAGFHSCSTKRAYWDAKVALGQDQQKGIHHFIW